MTPSSRHVVDVREYKRLVLLSDLDCSHQSTQVEKFQTPAREKKGRRKGQRAAHPLVVIPSKGFTPRSQKHQTTRGKTSSLIPPQQHRSKLLQKRLHGCPFAADRTNTYKLQPPRIARIDRLQATQTLLCMRLKAPNRLSAAFPTARMLYCTLLLHKTSTTVLTEAPSPSGTERLYTTHHHNHQPKQKEEEKRRFSPQGSSPRLESPRSPRRHL